MYHNQRQIGELLSKTHGEEKIKTAAVRQRPRLLPLVPTADTGVAEMQQHGNVDGGDAKDDDDFVCNKAEGKEKDKSKQEHGIHQSQLKILIYMKVNCHFH